jgi:hypothetical protein
MGSLSKIASTIQSIFNSASFLSAVNAQCAANGISQFSPVNATNGNYLWLGASQIPPESPPVWPVLIMDFSIPDGRPLGTGGWFNTKVQITFTVVTGATDSFQERKNLNLYADSIEDAVVGFGLSETQVNGIHILLVSPGGESLSGEEYTQSGPIYVRKVWVGVVMWISWPAISTS